MLREIAIMQKLRHPNVVHQQDMVESEDGMLYIVMEYVPGLASPVPAPDSGARGTEHALE